MLKFIKNLALWPAQVIGETILLRVRLHRAEREIERLQAENLALRQKPTEAQRQGTIERLIRERNEARQEREDLAGVIRRNDISILIGKWEARAAQYEREMEGVGLQLDAVARTNMLRWRDAARELRECVRDEKP